MKYIAAAMAVLAAVVPAEANLLSNPGFEQQGTWSGSAEWWEWGNPDTHGAIWGNATRESWRAHSGSWEGTIRGAWSGSDYGGWWQEKRATPGVTYTFSAWFWADSTWTNQQDQGMKIEFFDGTEEESGQMIYAVTNAFSDIGEAWVQKTVQAVAPTNAVWVRVVIYASGVGQDGALQFDDLVLEEEPGTLILISRLGAGGLLCAGVLGRVRRRK